MFLHIAGTGAMARAIADECKRRKVAYAFWNGAPTETHSGAVVIHVGRKERLLEAIEWCTKTGTPLIHAASGLDHVIPDPPTFPVVMAPNLALRVVEFMEMVRFFSKAHQLKKNGHGVQIKVSHQLTKMTPPGTAYAIAELLGLSREAVLVLQTEEEQRQLGVPDEHLVRHSYHSVLLQSSPDCTIELKVNINGLREHAQGALEVAFALDTLRPTLEPGMYSVLYILRKARKKTVPG